MGVPEERSMKPDRHDTDNLEQRVKTASRYAWIVLGVGMVSFIGDLITTLQQHLWQMRVMAGASLALVILAVLSLLACRRKQPNLTAMFLASSGVILTIPSAFLVEGMGIVGGIANILVTTVIATQIASRQYRKILPALGIASGIIAILIQLFIHPSWRISIVSPIIMGIIIAASVLTLLVYLILQFRTFPIRTKLLVAFLSLSLTAIVTIAYASYLTTRQALANSVGDRMSSISQAQALAVGEYFARNLDLIKVLALDPEIIKSTVDANGVYPADRLEATELILKLDQQWIASKVANNLDDPLVQSRLNNPSVGVLKEFQKLYADHVEIYVTDQYGALVASTAFTPGYFQGVQGWFIAAYSSGRGNPYISLPEMDSSSKTYNIVISTPIVDPATNLLSGVIHSTLRITTLINLLTEESGTTVDSDLIFIDRSPIILNEDRVDFLDSNEIDEITNVLNKPFVEMQFRGAQNLVSVTSIRTNTRDSYVDKLEFWVLTFQPTDLALAPVQSQTNLIAILAIIISGVVVGAAVVIGNYLARPIMHLTEAAEKVMAGDLTVQSNIVSQDEIGTLSTTFDNMTTRLRETISGLEQRIAERTRAIELSSQVSRRLSTILNPQQLVLSVVNEVQSAFNYYHAQIYLFDEASEYLVLAGGTGEAGRVLLEKGHKIGKGKGLVGQAANTKQAVLTPDTRADPNWLPNPLLPETRAEVAVPIFTGEKVYGVLDVQHSQANGLTERDALLLQSIANQVAIALQNASLFTQTQRQAERETLVNTIAQQLQTSTTIEGVLQVLARELGVALQARRVTTQMGKWELNAQSEVIPQEGVR